MGFWWDLDGNLMEFWWLLSPPPSLWRWLWGWRWGDEEEEGEAAEKRSDARPRHGQVRAEQIPVASTTALLSTGGRSSCWLTPGGSTTALLCPRPSKSLDFSCVCPTMDLLCPRGSKSLWINLLQLYYGQEKEVAAGCPHGCYYRFTLSWRK